MVSRDPETPGPRSTMNTVVQEQEEHGRVRSGAGVEEAVGICVTRDAAFSSEPPEPSSIV